MDKNLLFNEVVEIITRLFGIKKEEIKPESSLINDLEIDSLASLQFIMELEEVLDIEIPEEVEAIFATATIDDLLKVLVLLIKERPAVVIPVPGQRETFGDMASGVMMMRHFTSVPG